MEDKSLRLANAEAPQCGYLLQANQAPALIYPNGALDASPTSVLRLACYVIATLDAARRSTQGEMRRTLRSLH